VVKKASKKSTTSRPVAKLPLHSSDWWSWARAIPYVREQLGRDVGDFDLAAAMNRRDARIKLEAIDRRANPPKRISLLLEDEFFRDFRIEPMLGKLVTVALVPNVRLPRDHALFAWGPDLQKLWPASPAGSGDASEDTSSSETRRKPGKRAVYPLWKLEAAIFIHRFFNDNKRWPIASEVAEYLGSKYEWEPNEKAIRELLKFLLPE
jgi:hypothetical protein